MTHPRPVHPVVVVGAGPAGLAVAAELERRGVEALLLEAGDTPGWTWRRHDPWLYLHTTRRDSSLAGRPMVRPPGAGPYPHRDEVVDYLDRLADGLGSEIRLRTAVCRVEPVDGRWAVETDAGERLAARHVVLATGFNRVPVRPVLPGEERFGGTVVHSSEVSSAFADLADLAGRQVLVVGLGNTGADLVTALSDAGARVSVAVRTPLHLVPLKVLGVNWRTWFRLAPGGAFGLGRLVGPRGRRAALALAARAWHTLARRRFCDVAARGLPLQTPEEIVAHWLRGRPPLTAGRFVDRIADGTVAVLPALAAFEPGVAVLADGRRVRADAVVFATGFRPALGELLPAEALPRALRDGGAEASAWGAADARPGPLPGLWLCGFAPELSRIRRAARRVARSIAADLASVEISR
jgi:putative flavoprotein involved in K+ transport